jgi:hypothetical protein
MSSADTPPEPLEVDGVGEGVGVGVGDGDDVEGCCASRSSPPSVGGTPEASGL